MEQNDTLGIYLPPNAFCGALSVKPGFMDCSVDPIKELNKHVMWQFHLIPYHSKLTLAGGVFSSASFVPSFTNFNAPHFSLRSAVLSVAVVSETTMINLQQ